MYKELYLTITNECQLRCPHCYKDDYGLSLLSFNNIKSLLEKYPDIKYITLYGGEPLLEKYTDKVLDIIKYLKEKDKIILCSSNLCFEKLSNNQIDIIQKIDDISTSWNPRRFTESQEKYWINNLNILSKFKCIHLLVTLTKDLIEKDVNKVFNYLNNLPVETIKFEPFIGNNDNRPSNKDVDYWLDEYYNLCLNNNTIEKYTLFNDIINSIKDNSNYGIFSRSCLNDILTLKPNGEIINCPNMKSSYLDNNSEKLNIAKYNPKCLKCEHFSFCNGSCPLLEFDENYCCGYPKLFSTIKKSINNFI